MPTGLKTWLERIENVSLRQSQHQKTHSNKQVLSRVGQITTLRLRGQQQENSRAAAENTTVVLNTKLPYGSPPTLPRPLFLIVDLGIGFRVLLLLGKHSVMKPNNYTLRLKKKKPAKTPIQK